MHSEEDSIIKQANNINNEYGEEYDAQSCHIALF